MSSPRYEHDCEQCVYLGQEDDFDLYYCNKISIPTVIARYSPNGPDYLSGMPYPNQKQGPLVAARKLAAIKGFTLEPEKVV